MNQLLYLWNHIDAKLRSAVLSAAVAWVVAKYAINLDPSLSAAIAGVIASVTGYTVPNDATVLRTDQEDGNAYPPEGDPA